MRNLVYRGPVFCHAQKALPQETRPMKEKEVRLALVCYGGVSLVLYMHGVIKELLKLTRASKVYPSIADQERRQAETFASLNGPDGRERDTEEAYFSLLKVICRKLDLRVIVDSVAGACGRGCCCINLALPLARNPPSGYLRQQGVDEGEQAGPADH